jgi:hypothetical protein
VPWVGYWVWSEAAAETLWVPGQEAAGSAARPGPAAGAPLASRLAWGIEVTGAWGAIGDGPNVAGVAGSEPAATTRPP